MRFDMKRQIEMLETSFLPRYMREQLGDLDLVQHRAISSVIQPLRRYLKCQSDGLYRCLQCLKYRYCNYAQD